MAMAAAPVVTEVLSKGAAKVEDTLDDIGKNPIAWVEHFLVKWGSIITLAGVGMYALYLAGKRASQGYLNDIDQTLGIPTEQKPTPAVKTVEVKVQPPPVPPQIALLNTIVSDLNALGTSSVPSNVMFLQDSLQQLWSLARYVYSPGGSNPYGPVPTLTPVTGSNTTGNAQGLGPQLAIAIMQNCLLILEFGGQDPSAYPEWNGNSWTDTEVYGPNTYPGATNGPIGATNGYSAWSFLNFYSTLCLAPFDPVGPTWWPQVKEILSNTDNKTNFKQTINGLAEYLNTTTPFDLSLPPPANHFGILGAVVQDIGAFEAGAINAAASTGAAVEGAFVQAGKDLQAVVSDVGAGLGMIAKGIVNFPRLLGDSFGYFTSWAGEMIGEVLYPILIGVGATMLTLGVGMRWGRREVWPRVAPRIALKERAFLDRLVEKHLDPWVKPKLALAEVRAEQVEEGEIAAALAAPVAEAPVAESAPIPPPGPAEHVETAPEISEPTPDQTNALATPPGEAVPAPVALSEAPVPPEGSTASAESFLGEHPTRAPTVEELRAGEAARLETLPPAPPSYAERKRERARVRAERFVAAGESWGESAT